jgi:2-keto-4-pentenoate hydratase/2-oxohepta-3-ene-1,7-dioic acid hydratase in catechol pathway
MGFVRFRRKNEYVRPGLVLGDEVVDLEQSPIELPASETYLSHLDSIETQFRERSSTADNWTVYDTDSVSIACPVTPQTVVSLEGCYEHDLVNESYDPLLADEDYHKQSWPSLSVAPISAVRGPGEPLRLPSYATDVRPGLEVGLVVGDTVRNCSPDDALDTIVGYTTVTTLRIFDGIPDLEGYKMYDGSFACGPEIVSASESDLQTLSLEIQSPGAHETWLTDAWRFTPGEMVAEASKILTLEPGDIVLTGAPTRIEQSVTDGSLIRSSVGDITDLEKTVATDLDDE